MINPAEWYPSLEVKEAPEGKEEEATSQWLTAMTLQSLEAKDAGEAKEDSIRQEAYEEGLKDGENEATWQWVGAIAVFLIVIWIL